MAIGNGARVLTWRHGGKKAASSVEEISGAEKGRERTRRTTERSGRRKRRRREEKEKGATVFEVEGQVQRKGASGKTGRLSILSCNQDAQKGSL